MNHLRRWGRETEASNVVHVVAEGGSLIDDLRIRLFRVRPEGAGVADLTPHGPVLVEAH